MGLAGKTDLYHGYIFYVISCTLSLWSIRDLHNLGACGLWCENHGVLNLLM